MLDRFRVSSLLRQKLLDLSVSPEAVLRRAGLPSGLFDQDKIFLPTETLFALYQAIGEISGDAGIGLKLGAEDRVERYDPVAIAALYARSFRDAIGRAARYKLLTCPEQISVLDRPQASVVRFEWLRSRQTESPLLVDLCFAWLLGIGRRGIGQPVTPVRVEFKREPGHRDIYERHFGCSVRFQAGHNALVFQPEDLDRPFVTHNPDLVAMIAPQLERDLACRMVQQGTRDQVKTTLKRLLAGRRPSVKEVAKELAQSARTLQRRLADAGATYQGMLEEARDDLARHYLLHSDLELSEVAYLLGYEDANSFFRAFQRWEGKPPGRWRDETASTAGPSDR